MTPKIAIFLQNLAGGGADRMMLNLANGIAERGINVDLVLSRAEGVYLANVAQGVRVVDLGVRRTLFSVPFLARYLRRERPTALLSALVHVNVAAILAARLARTKARIVISERAPISRNAGSAASTFVRLAHRSVPWLYPLADGIVAVSQGVAEDLARFGRLPLDRIVAINNPVVTGSLERQASEPVDHPWFAAGAPPVILGVGRLAAVKDFATLLRVFAKVRRERTAKLMILGEGPERRALEALVQELDLTQDVEMPGFVDNPYAVMARAAVLVLSSRWEGSPNVLVEAMACGTQVVVTDCPGGAAEILVNGRFGRLVPVGDSRRLAEAIKGALDDPVSAEQLRKRADDFAVERSVSRYLNILLGETAN